MNAKQLQTFEGGVFVPWTNADAVMLQEQITAEEKFKEIDKELEAVQIQDDGRIVSYEGTEIPTLNNEPTVNWATSEYKDHVGDIYDLYIPNDNGGLTYSKYVFTINPITGNYTWMITVDDAFSDVREELGLIGLNSRIIYQELEPSLDDVKVNDVWIEVLSKSMYICTLDNDIKTWFLIDNSQLLLMSALNDSVLSSLEKETIYYTEYNLFRVKYNNYIIEKDRYGVDSSQLTEAYNNLNSIYLQFNLFEKDDNGNYPEQNLVYDTSDTILNNGVKEAYISALSSYNLEVDKFNLLISNLQSFYIQTGNLINESSKSVDITDTNHTYTLEDTLKANKYYACTIWGFLDNNNNSYFQLSYNYNEEEVIELARIKYNDDNAYTVVFKTPNLSNITKKNLIVSASLSSSSPTAYIQNISLLEGMVVPIRWTESQSDLTKRLEEYADNYKEETIFYKTKENTLPIIPDNTSHQEDEYIPDGWTDNYTGTTSEWKYSWRATRKRKDGLWGVFTTPKLFSNWSIDGVTYYTWIKYADDSNGVNMSDIPDNKAYIGEAYNKLYPIDDELAAEEANNPSTYHWRNILTDGYVGGVNLLAKTSDVFDSSFTRYADNDDIYNLDEDEQCWVKEYNFADISETDHLTITYNLSLDVQSLNNKEGRHGILLIDGNNEKQFTETSFNGLIQTNDKYRYSFLKDSNLNVNTLKANWFIICSNLYSNTAFSLNHLKAEDGTTATSWTESPKDILERIDNAKDNNLEDKVYATTVEYDDSAELPLPYRDENGVLQDYSGEVNEDGKSAIWNEDYIEPNAEYPYTWQSTRIKNDGVWSAFGSPRFYSNFSVAEGGVTGTPGRGIEKVTNYYLATDLSGGVTTDTLGWKENISDSQISKLKPFLWNYESIKYTTAVNGVDTSKTTPVIIGKYSSDGRSVTSIEEWYIATLTSEKPGYPNEQYTWTQDMPTISATNRYIWNYEVFNYSSADINGNSSIKTNIRLLSQGLKEITTTVDYYALSDQTTGVVYDETWTTDVNSLVFTTDTPHLWNHQVTSYTYGVDTSTTSLIYTYSVNGEVGASGTGIKSIKEYYAVNNSINEIPTDWMLISSSSEIPPLTINQRYLWNYNVVILDDNTELPGAKHVAAIYGDTGSQGIGVKDVVNYYLASTATSISKEDIDDYDWTESIQSANESLPYLWNYEKIIYSNDSYTVTLPAIISNWSKDGAKADVIQEWYVTTTNQDKPTAPPNPSKDDATGTVRGGWTLNTTTPTDDYNKYLWNHEITWFTDGSFIACDVVPIAVTGTAGTNGINGKGIDDITTWFLTTNKSSGVTWDEEGWKENNEDIVFDVLAPYLWKKELITYNDGSEDKDPSTKRIEPFLIGKQGMDGDSIRDIEEWFITTTTKEEGFNLTYTNPGWSNEVQDTDAINRYLWGYNRINYTNSNGSSAWFENTAIRLLGLNGDNGKDGVSVTWHDYEVNENGDHPTDVFNGYAYYNSYFKESYVYYDEEWFIVSKDGFDGKDGRYAVATDVLYKVTDGAIAPTYDVGGENEGWYSSLENVDKNSYLWQVQVTTYDKGEATATNVSYVNRAEGRSVTSVKEQYYLSTSKTERVNGEWLFSQPKWEEGKYLWVRTYIEYDSSPYTSTTEPYIDSSWEMLDTIEIGGDNLIIVSTLSNGYLTSNGSVTANKDYNYTDYIEINKLYSGFIASGMSNYGDSVSTCYYNSDKEFVVGVSHDAYSPTNDLKVYKEKFPENDDIKYLRFSLDISNSVLGNTAKLEWGNRATSWTPAQEDIEFSSVNLLDDSAERDSVTGNSFYFFTNTISDIQQRQYYTIAVTNNNDFAIRLAVSKRINGANNGDINDSKVINPMSRGSFTFMLTDGVSNSIALYFKKADNTVIGEFSIKEMMLVKGSKIDGNWSPSESDRVKSSLTELLPYSYTDEQWETWQKQLDQGMFVFDDTAVNPYDQSVGMFLVNNAYVKNLGAENIAAKGITADKINADGIEADHGKFTNATITGSMTGVVDFAAAYEGSLVDTANVVYLTEDAASSYTLPSGDTYMGREIQVYNGSFKSITIKPVSFGCVWVDGSWNVEWTYTSAIYYLKAGHSMLFSCFKTPPPDNDSDSHMRGTWKILNRYNSEGTGLPFSILATGCIDGTLSIPTIERQQTFDNSIISVTRLDTGRYSVNFTPSWRGSDMSIILTGEGHVKNSSSPTKATTYDWGVDFVIIETSYDHEVLDGKFSFIVYTYNQI